MATPSKNSPKTLAELLTIAVASGFYTTYTQKSKAWFRSSAQNMNVTGSQFLKEATNNNSDLKTKLTQTIYVGNLHFYQYDPKTKKKLPYYDMYPIVFPIQRYKDGFLGLNLHYLPPVLRAKLMDALYKTLSDTKYNFNTKLKITYNILNAATRYKWFRPCVKRYLYSHIVGGRILRIAPKEWELTLFLPLAKFRKQPKEHVWSESRKKIK